MLLPTGDVISGGCADWLRTSKRTHARRSLNRLARENRIRVKKHLENSVI